MSSRYDELYYKRRCIEDCISDEPVIEVTVIDERVGKGLFLKKALPEGTEIWRERPLVCIQHIPSSADVISCANCCRDIGTVEEQLQRCAELETLVEPLVGDSPSFLGRVLPCESGCGASYCSEECAREAWTEHHQLLCVGDITSETHPLFRFKVYCLQYNEIFQLAARVFARIIRRCFETGEMSRHPFNLLRAVPWSEAVVYASPEQHQHQHDHQHEDDEDECFSSSEGDMFTSKLSAEELEQHALGAFMLLREALLHESVAARDPQLALTTAACFQEGLLDARFFSCCVGMFETNCTSIELNSCLGAFAASRLRGAPEAPAVLRLLDELAPPEEARQEDAEQVTDAVVDDLNSRFPGFEGIGVYDLIAVMNHSCCPNTVVTYTSNRVATVETTRDVAEGEELTHSYIEGFEELSVEERNALLQCWGFRCVCPACV